VALCQARTSTKPLWGLSSSNPYHPSHVPNTRVQRFRLNKIIKKIHKLYFPELFRFFRFGFDICINLCDFTTQIKFLQKKLFCTYTLLLQNAHKTAFKRGKKSFFLALKFCNHQRPRKTELLHCVRQQILMPCMYAQSLCIYASMFIFLNVYNVGYTF